MPPPRHVPEVTKFLRELLGGFSPLLLAGSLLCFVAFFIQLGSMSPVEVPFDNVSLSIGYISNSGLNVNEMITRPLLTALVEKHFTCPKNSEFIFP